MTCHDPGEHVHDEGQCCECGDPRHCCCDCPIYCDETSNEDADVLKGRPWTEVYPDNL